MMTSNDINESLIGKRIEGNFGGEKRVGTVTGLIDDKYTYGFVVKLDKPVFMMSGDFNIDTWYQDEFEVHVRKYDGFDWGSLKDKTIISDSRRVRDDAHNPILHFHTGRGGRFYNQGYTTYVGVYDEGLTSFALTYGATTSGDGDYQDGEELVDESGKALGAKYGDMVGYLDWDGDYDSDSFVYLNDVEFDDYEFQTIVASDEYLEPSVREYVASLFVDNLNAYTLNNLPLYNEDDYEDNLDAIVSDVCRDYGVKNGGVISEIRDILSQKTNA